MPNPEDPCLGGLYEALFIILPNPEDPWMGGLYEAIHNNFIFYNL